MRLELIALLVAVFYLLNFPVITNASSRGGSCDLPQSLQGELATKYPGKHIVRSEDLGRDDKQIFRQAHGPRCPGLVRVNFYGDGTPTWGLVLIEGENPQRKAELVVARQLGAEWEIRSLETTSGTPVVWREGPGRYRDMYKKKTIRATKPVIVFEGLESWAIIYAWTGKEIKKVQVSD